VINCDAHRPAEAGWLRLGAGMARKAGLTRDDVVNSLPLKKLRQELRRKPTG
jgi:histidinol phosphatase-like PHP family hydrolase